MGGGGGGGGRGKQKNLKGRNLNTERLWRECPWKDWQGRKMTQNPAQQDQLDGHLLLGKNLRLAGGKGCWVEGGRGRMVEEVGYG